MRQWFSGRFAGHYRGTPQNPTSLSPYQEAEHFRIEVYEALVSEIELRERLTDPESVRSGVAGEPSSSEHEPALHPEQPRFHHQPEGKSLHQSHVAQVHFIDALQLGQTVRSTAHDVLMSDLRLSHPARHNSLSFGRIEGRISGWFRPPPEPPAIEEVAPPAGPAPVGWATDVIASPSAQKEESNARSPQNAETPADVNLRKPLRRSSLPQKRKPETRSAMDRHRASPAPSAQDHADERQTAGLIEDASPPFEYPFFAGGVAITILLGVFAAPPAMLLFAPTFLLAYALRRWLLGVVPEATGVQFLSLLLSGGQVLLALPLVARWSEAGCVSLSPLPLILLLGAPLLASLLPRPLPFAITSAMFALVLFQAYANGAPPMCS